MVSPFRLDVPQADLDDLRRTEAELNALPVVTELDSGGHFASLERPQTFVDELRGSCAIRPA